MIVKTEYFLLRKFLNSCKKVKFFFCFSSNPEAESSKEDSSKEQFNLLYFSFIPEREKYLV